MTTSVPETARKRRWRKPSADEAKEPTERSEPESAPPRGARGSRNNTWRSVDDTDGHGDAAGVPPALDLFGPSTNLLKPSAPTPPFRVACPARSRSSGRGAPQLRAVDWNASYKEYMSKKLNDAFSTVVAGHWMWMWLRWRFSFVPVRGNSLPSRFHSRPL